MLRVLHTSEPRVSQRCCSSRTAPKSPLRCIGVRHRVCRESMRKARIAWANPLEWDSKHRSRSGRMRAHPAQVRCTHYISLPPFTAREPMTLWAAGQLHAREDLMTPTHTASVAGPLGADDKDRPRLEYAVHEQHVVNTRIKDLRVHY